jgi:hypothetical protein
MITDEDEDEEKMRARRKKEGKSKLQAPQRLQEGVAPSITYTEDVVSSLMCLRVGV